jgi:hypothetical protein
MTALDARCSMLDTRYSMLDTRYSMLDAGAVRPLPPWISDFGFAAQEAGHPNRYDKPIRVVLWCGRPGCTCRRDACATRRTAGTVRYPTVIVTRGLSSTVGAPQSVSKAIFHSYLSESLGGPGPTWLSEGGWAGGGGGKNEVRARRLARMQPAGAFTGGAWHPDMTLSST